VFVSPLRVLIADDEPLARELVRRYVMSMHDAEIVSDRADGDAFAAALATRDIDVVLLDVRMPGADVFSVLERMTPLPAVIFTTAYDDYAVRAFEFNAVDSLVKPFTESRLHAAPERARTRLPNGDSRALVRLATDLGPCPARLLAPHGRRLVPVAVRDIEWIQAQGDYVRVHSRGAEFLVQRTLKDLEKRLDARTFIRIHRSAIVHIEHIVEVRPEPGGRYRLQLRDGTSLIVSRSRVPRLRSWMI
jgi:two-component system, LytTR family, response regulator